MVVALIYNTVCSDCKLPRKSVQHQISLKFGLIKFNLFEAAASQVRPGNIKVVLILHLIVSVRTCLKGFSEIR